MTLSVIFDLDGTLADTQADIWTCLESACQENDLALPGSMRSSKEWIGPPIRDVLCKAFPELGSETINQVIQSFRTAYDSSDYPGTKLFPKILEMLKQFQDNGVQLFIATNKPAYSTKRILPGLGIADFFAGVATPDSLGDRLVSKRQMIAWIINQWDLHPQNTCMVGDATSDLDAGRTNDIQVIAVTWGYTPKDRLEVRHPDYCVDDVDTLTRTILSQCRLASEGEPCHS